MSAAQPVASPCISVCTLDESGRVCLGCCRTTDEIAVWVAMSPAERARIIGELPRRRLRREGLSTRLEPRPCPRCGLEFGCGANDGREPCWCASSPRIEPEAGASCLCPACLAAAATRRE